MWWSPGVTGCEPRPPIYAIPPPPRSDACELLAVVVIDHLHHGQGSHPRCGRQPSRRPTVASILVENHYRSTSSSPHLGPLTLAMHKSRARHVVAPRPHDGRRCLLSARRFHRVARLSQKVLRRRATDRPSRGESSDVMTTEPF